MLTSYVLQYKLVCFNLPLAENWLVALRLHVVFLLNARKWEPLTDFSRIDRRYDLIVTKKSVDLSHQRYKIRNCHWKLLFAFSFLYFSFFVTNTVMAHEMQFFQSYLISYLYSIYIQNDFKQGKSEGFGSCDWPIVRKRPIWVKLGDVLSRVTLKFDGRPWKTIGHLSFAVSSFVQHFIAIGEFKLELLSGNAQFWSNSTIFRAVWPWNLTYDLEKQ